MLKKYIPKRLTGRIGYLIVPPLLALALSCGEGDATPISFINNDHSQPAIALTLPQKNARNLDGTPSQYQLPACAEQPDTDTNLETILQANPLHTNSGQINYIDILGKTNQARVIYVSEEHNEEPHLTLEYGVLEHLIKQGKPVVVAMEMFYADHNSVINQYLNDKINEEEFVRRTWSDKDGFLLPDRHFFEYDCYSDLINLAKENGVTVKGLDLNHYESWENPKYDEELAKEYPEWARKLIFPHDRDAYIGLQVSKIQEENPDSVVLVIAHAGHIHGMYSQEEPLSEESHKRTIPYWATQLSPNKGNVISLTTIMKPIIYPEGAFRPITASHAWFTLPTAHSPRDYVTDFYIGHLLNLNVN